MTTTRTVGWISSALSLVGEGHPLSSVFEILRTANDFPFFAFGVNLGQAEGELLNESKYRLPACGVNMHRDRALAAALAEGIERYAFVSWSPQESSTLCLNVPPTGNEFQSLPLLLPPGTAFGDAIKQAHTEDRQFYTPSMVSRGQGIPFPLGVIAGTNKVPWLQTTTGTAAGFSFEEAATYAIYELIERDTLMGAWRNNIQGQSVAFDRVISSRLLNALHRLGSRKATFLVRAFMSDIEVPVFVAAIVMGAMDAPSGVYLGAAASLSAEEGVERAFNEAIMGHRASSSPQHRQTPSTEQSARLLNSFYHHAVFYQNPEMAPKVIQWLASDDPYSFPNFNGAKSHLDNLFDRVHAVGFRCFLYDITPRQVENTGLKIVRAIVPGLVPLSVGTYEAHHLPRFCGNRVFKTGRQFTRSESVNLFPHPFP